MFLKLKYIWRNVLTLIFLIIYLYTYYFYIIVYKKQNIMNTYAPKYHKYFVWCASQQAMSLKFIHEMIRFCNYLLKCMTILHCDSVDILNYVLDILNIIFQALFILFVKTPEFMNILNEKMTYDCKSIVFWDFSWVHRYEYFIRYLLQGSTMLKSKACNNWI